MRPILSDSSPLLSAFRREPSLQLRVEVMRRDRYTCQYCQVARATEIDHVQPWDQGGLTIASNLAAACEHCNRSKGGRTPAEWEAAKRRQAAAAAALAGRARQARRQPLKKARRIPASQAPAPTLFQLLQATRKSSP